MTAIPIIDLIFGVLLLAACMIIFITVRIARTAESEMQVEQNYSSRVKAQLDTAQQNGAILHNHIEYLEGLMDKNKIPHIDSITCKLKTYNEQQRLHESFNEHISRYPKLSSYTKKHYNNGRADDQPAGRTHTGEG